MKRFLTTILCVLCVLAAYAVSYGTSYKGSGHSGLIYTTSSAHTTSIGSGGVMASAPIATMGSTSLSSTRGITSGGTQIAGIRTTIGLGGTPLKGTGPDLPTDPWWGCNCVDENGDGKCDICGCDLTIVPEGGSCGCDPYCRCPIEDGWPVWMFMIAMAMVYMVYKKREKHRTKTSVMRT